VAYSWAMSSAQKTRSERAPRVLVLGYDRTDSARHAARWAANELAGEGKLVIVHACRPLHAPPSALMTGEERRRSARALIDELLLEGEDALFDVDTEAEISDADPVSALLDAAERYGAHAIVIGSEPHSRLHKAIGTVTTELLQRSSVPVIAVPGTDAGPRRASCVPPATSLAAAASAHKR
jgi:nucleotide-binding universal stress UspA family protein